MLLNEYGENRVYDPLRDSWSDGKGMPTLRSEFGVAVVDDILYAIGGCTKDQTASSKNEQYIPIGYQSTHSTSKTFPIYPYRSRINSDSCGSYYSIISLFQKDEKQAILKNEKIHLLRFKFLFAVVICDVIDLAVNWFVLL
jgi:hypothetical protein